MPKALPTRESGQSLYEKPPSRPSNMPTGEAGQSHQLTRSRPACDTVATSMAWNPGVRANTGPVMPTGELGQSLYEKSPSMASLCLAEHPGKQQASRKFGTGAETTCGTHRTTVCVFVCLCAHSLVKMSKQLADREFFTTVENLLA